MTDQGLRTRDGPRTKNKGPRTSALAPPRRGVDVGGHHVVHRIAGPERQSAIPELSVDRELVVLVSRISDAVDREHAAPPLAVLRELDALDRRVVVLDVERDDRAAAIDAHT